MIIPLRVVGAECQWNRAVHRNWCVKECDVSVTMWSAVFFSVFHLISDVYPLLQTFTLLLLLSHPYAHFTHIFRYVQQSYFILTFAKPNQLFSSTHSTNRIQFTVFFPLRTDLAFCVYHNPYFWLILNAFDNVISFNIFIRLYILNQKELVTSASRPNKYIEWNNTVTRTFNVVNM